MSDGYEDFRGDQKKFAREVTKYGVGIIIMIFGLIFCCCVGVVTAIICCIQQAQAKPIVIGPPLYVRQVAPNNKPKAPETV